MKNNNLLKVSDKDFEVIDVALRIVLDQLQSDYVMSQQQTVKEDIYKNIQKFSSVYEKISYQKNLKIV